MSKDDSSKDKTQDEVLYIPGDTPKRKFPIRLRDKLQVRYEMIRQAALSRDPIGDVCAKFGYSRDMYYYYRDKFNRNGLIGLLPEKSGPKRPTKRTEELEKKILELRFSRPELNMYEINDLLKKENFEVSPRTIARVLDEHGLVKKKRKKTST